MATSTLNGGGTVVLRDGHGLDAPALWRLVARDGVEVLSILADKLGLKGGIWDWVGELDFGIIGVGIIAIFALSWGVSTAIYRWKRYDDLPVKRQPQAPAPQG